MSGNKEKYYVAYADGLGFKERVYLASKEREKVEAFYSKLKKTSFPLGIAVYFGTFEATPTEFNALEGDETLVTETIGGEWQGFNFEIIDTFGNFHLEPADVGYGLDVTEEEEEDFGDVDPLGGYQSEDFSEIEEDLLEIPEEAVFDVEEAKRLFLTSNLF